MEPQQPALTMSSRERRSCELSCRRCPTAALPSQPNPCATRADALARFRAERGSRLARKGAHNGRTHAHIPGGGLRPRVPQVSLGADRRRRRGRRGETCQQTLSRLGYDAYAIASSAEEAVAEALKRRPDVVLVDVEMKGTLDGIDAAEILRSRFSIPIVYLTAHADDATIARANRTEPDRLSSQAGGFG